MRRTTWVVIAAAGVLAVTGCAVDGNTPTGGDAASSETASSPGSTASPESPEPTVPDDLQPRTPRRQPVTPSPAASQARPPATGEAPRDILAKVVADAADRAGVGTARVDVIRSEAVQWRDGSLGCPEPGQFYTQALVDGYWIELRAGGEDFDYRLDGHGNFRLCEQALPQPPYGTDR